MIKHLYVNGCSFVCDHTISKHFVDHMAQRCGWLYTIAAWPGSCNRRIIRTTLKDSLEFDHTTQVIVSLSLLDRTEINVYGERNLTDLRMPGEDWFQGIKSDHTGNQFKYYRDTWIRNFNDYGEAVNLATDVLALTAHLKVRNIPYLIYSHRDLFYGHKGDIISVLDSHPIFQALSQDPCVINLLHDSLYQRLGTGDWSYDSKWPQGHLNEHGHVHAAAVLLGLLNTPN